MANFSDVCWLYTACFSHLTQKHLATENPRRQIRIGKTRRAFLTHQHSKIPKTSKSYQAKTNLLISPGKVSDLIVKRYVSNVNKRVK